MEIVRRETDNLSTGRRDARSATHGGQGSPAGDLQVGLGRRHLTVSHAMIFFFFLH